MGRERKILTDFESDDKQIIKCFVGNMTLFIRKRNVLYSLSDINDLQKKIVQYEKGSSFINAYKIQMKIVID